MVNPIQLELIDLISLKTQADFFNLPDNRKNTFTGFGENKSLLKTRGLNFQEVRQYQPGDDIRQIDWRVTAKYGKPFTKLYAEEKEKQIYILCDLRPSMQFASHGHFKSVMAGRLSALIGFIAEKKNDILSYQILSNSITQSLGMMPAHDALPYFLNQLSKDFNFDSNIQFNQIIPFMEKNIRLGSLIFLLSDFHDVTLDDFKFLGDLSRKSTITCVHLYDKMESNLPNGVLPFSDGKHEMLIDTSTKNFKKDFYNSWEHRTKLLHQNIQKYHMGYLALSTDSNYIHQFQSYCLGSLI